MQVASADTNSEEGLLQRQHLNKQADNHARGMKRLLDAHAGGERMEHKKGGIRLSGMAGERILASTEMHAYGQPQP